MNKTIPLRQIGLAGEIKDIANSDIPTQGVRSARSIRIQDQSLSSFSNASVFLDDVANETFLFCHPFTRSSGDGWIVVSKVTGSPDTIKVEFVDLTGSKTDVSPPVSMSTTATEWQAVQLGSYFIITNNSAVDNPHWTSAALAQMVDLPGWPTTYKCNVLSVYKNILVAVGISKSGGSGEESRMVKWSHPFADGDTQTYWDHTDPTLLAGETLLAEPGGNLTALQPVRDSLMIYFERRTWKADFIGGEYVLEFKKVFEDDGCVGPLSHAITSDGAVVFGYRDIYVHDGFSKQSISDQKNTRYLYDTLNLNFKPVAAYYPKRNEVVFLCRSYSSGDGNLFFIANSIHNYAFTQVVAELNGNGILKHIAVGPRPADSSVNYSGLTSETYEDFGDTTYAQMSGADETVSLLGVSSYSGVVWNMDYAGATNPVTTFRRDAMIEHRAIDLDEAGEGANKIIYLNRIIPQMAGQGVVKFTVGTHATAEGSIDWKASVTYDLDDDTDYAVDVRAAGRYLAYRIEPNDTSNPALFSLNGLDIEISTPRGRR